MEDVSSWTDELNPRLRLLPHDQNTGGFYVCVLHKSESAAPAPAPSTSTSTAASASTSSGLKRALSPNAEDAARDTKKEKIASEGEASAPASGTATPTPAIPSAAEPDNNAGKKKKQDWSYREDPFTYAPESDPELVSIVKYFKLKDTFPRDTILVRNEEGKVVRVAYFTNQLVKVGSLPGHLTSTTCLPARSRRML